jgi:hypothetical protein
MNVALSRSAKQGADLFHNCFVNRVLHKMLWAAVLPLCALWAVAQATFDYTARRANQDHSTSATAPSRSATELPVQWQGAPLRPLALGEVEQRFAKHFPGTVARMTDGKQVLVLRTVQSATRMLHPATDCYRGLGYRIHSEQLEMQADQRRWRCFVAERSTSNGKRAVRVCERIEDAQGQGFTDTSAWYWASVAGQSKGPWQATTVASPL